MRTNTAFILVLFILILSQASCSSKAPKCPIETLLLNKNMFPEGTHEEPLESPISEYPRESAAQSFYYAPDLILHEVVNWHSSRDAKREYDDRAKSAFDVDNYMGPWETPDDIFSSSTAHDYYVACGIAHKVYQCRMIATYGEYSVFFRSYVSDNGITLPKVDELLQSIDERMNQCID